MSHVRKVRILALLLLAASLAPLGLSAATWEIDPAHSTVQFSVRHLMISNVKGTFGQFGGTIEHEEGKPEAASVQVTVATSSIDTGIDKRDEHLRSADFLYTEKYPEMTFTSTKVEPAGPKSAKITGDLTLHGVTRPVTIDAEFLGTVKDPWGGTRSGFTGSTTLNRKEFGLTWNEVLEAGGVVVGDEVTISLEVEAKLKTPAPPAEAAAPEAPAGETGSE